MNASERIRVFVDALPLYDGIRVLEIGCGTGVAARLVTQRIGSGHVTAIDRSSTSIEIARRVSESLLRSGHLRFVCAAAEEFVPDAGSPPFDLAFAMRVGALDGRDPAVGQRVLRNIAPLLRPSAPMYIDGGSPLSEVDLGPYRT